MNKRYYPGLAVMGTNWNYLQKLLAFFSFIIFIFFYTPTNAYVIPGPHLLDLMIEKLGTGKSLLISQKLSLYDAIAEQNIIELKETLKYNFPEKFRSDIQSEHTKRIHVFSLGTALTIIDNKIVSNIETRFDCYKDIFLYRSRILLQHKLALLGVDVSVSSLGRFQNKIIYVIGAKNPDKSVSQIWLDKNTFQPIRWIIIGKSNKSSGDVLEIRYGDWKRTNKTWYPVHIEFYHNDVLVREIYADKIKINPSFSDELFDIEHLKSVYLDFSLEEQDKDDSQELNDIQKTIKEFKKLYE